MDDDLLKPTLHVVGNEMSSDDTKWAMSMEIKLAKLAQEVTAQEQKSAMIEQLFGSKLDEVKRIVANHMDEEERTIARINDSMREIKRELKETREDLNERMDKSMKEIKEHIGEGYVSQINFERLAARINEDNAANQKSLLEFFEQRQEKSLKRVQTIVSIAVGVMSFISIFVAMGGGV